MLLEENSWAIFNYFISTQGCRAGQSSTFYSYLTEWNLNISILKPGLCNMVGRCWTWHKWWKLLAVSAWPNPKLLQSVQCKSWYPQICGLKNHKSASSHICYCLRQQKIHSFFFYCIWMKNLSFISIWNSIWYDVKKREYLNLNCIGKILLDIEKLFLNLIYFFLFEFHRYCFWLWFSIVKKIVILIDIIKINYVNFEIVFAYTY